jgi:hypothetical protein
MNKYWDVGYILIKWHGIYERLFIDLQYEYIVCGNDGVQVSYLFHDNHERIG